MKIFSYRRGIEGSRGHTLIEILVSAAIFIAVLSIAYTGFAVINRCFHHQSANIEIRQNARVALSNMSQYLRMAEYVYTGQTVTIEGITYAIPNAGASGQAIVFASPESGTAGSITYTITGYSLYLDPKRASRDPANPNARQLIMYEKRGVVPPVADTPASIVLSNLTKGSKRTIADYVKPGGAAFTLCSPCKSMKIKLSMEKRNQTNMPLQEESLSTQVTLRNI